MSPTDLTNGTANDLLYPADYPAEMQLDTIRPDDRLALRTRLSELKGIPRERWEEHDATDLGPALPGQYFVNFGAGLIAFFTPQPDGRFRIEGLGSQKTLEEFRRQVERGNGE